MLRNRLGASVLSHRSKKRQEAEGKAEKAAGKSKTPSVELRIPFAASGSRDWRGEFSITKKNAGISAALTRVRLDLAALAERMGA
jgi:hypothetical protein